MRSRPAFLPALLEVDGVWDDILARLSQVYKQDFGCGPCCLDGLPVLRDSRILPDGHGMDETFWHLVTRADKVSSSRLIDPRRAERLGWVRPMIEHAHDAAIRFFRYKEGTSKGGVRAYLWMADEDYVVILAARHGCYFLVTGYFISSQNKRDELSRKSEERSP